MTESVKISNNFGKIREYWHGKNIIGPSYVMNSYGFYTQPTQLSITSKIIKTY